MHPKCIPSAILSQFYYTREKAIRRLFKNVASVVKPLHSRVKTCLCHGLKCVALGKPITVLAANTGTIILTCSYIYSRNYRGNVKYSGNSRYPESLSRILKSEVLQNLFSMLTCRPQVENSTPDLPR